MVVGSSMAVPDVNTMNSVLVVEDNPGDARLVTELLAEGSRATMGVKVVERLNDACSLLSERRFDLILLDAFLPDSRSFYESITRLRETSDVPIVVMTGIAAGDTGPECIRWGADDFVTKDKLNADMLYRTVLHSVQRHQVHCQREQDIVELMKGSGPNNETVAIAAAPVVVVDQDGIIAFANEMALDIMDKKRPDVLQKPFLSVCTPVVEGTPKCGSGDTEKAISVERVADTLWNGKQAHILTLRAESDQAPGPDKPR